MDPEPRPPEEDGRAYGRGAFLGLVASGVSALWWGEPAWRRLSSALAPVTDLLPRDVRDLVPSSGWRIYTVAPTMPRFDPRTWRLRIDGLVERPLVLSYADLLRLPRAEQVSDFHCVTGWSVSRVRWAGVRFADLLAAARPLPEAGGLRFVSAEVPYEDSLSLAQSRLADAMVAYEMDGRPLSRAHGAPTRVVIPEMYGYKNVKWVRRIELVRRPGDGFWERLGYDRDAWVGRSNRA
jgi:DMSO/TMAO reductase YedYZ molybdopterin-dependent catalytic subunit